MDNTFFEQLYVSKTTDFSRFADLLDRTAHVIVIGNPGIGKSSLVRAYVGKSGSTHSDIKVIEGRHLNSRENAVSEIQMELRRLLISKSNAKKKPLLIVDGLDEILPATPVRETIEKMIRMQKEVQVVLTTRPNGFHFSNAQMGHDFHTLTLEGLSHIDLDHLLTDSKVSHTNEQVEQLTEISIGNPRIVSTIVSLLSTGDLKWDQLKLALSEFECQGIRLPNSHPTNSLTNEARVIIDDVKITNEDILRLIKFEPERIRELPPRKFEEVVAALLEKQGYSVELTPEKRDGGFDMYVASKQSLGSFLYLVECKRYTPPTKVGVHVVRGLYGVVQKKHANAGMIITSSYFTKGAVEFQDEARYNIHLHDFVQLKKWLKLI